MSVPDPQCFAKQNMSINQKLFNKIQKKKAVIWDFDGILLHADWNHGEGVDAYWERLWKFLEEIDPNIRKTFVGRTQHYSLLKYPYEHTDYIVQKYGQFALNKINKFYLKKELQILPSSLINTDLAPYFNQFNSQIEHYIWSNNEGLFIKKGLEKAGILSKFKGIISRDKVLLAKPHLDGFKIIQTLTSFTIEDFLFVGDSLKTDMIVAKSLGMDFFYYPSF